MFNGGSVEQVVRLALKTQLASHHPYRKGKETLESWIDRVFVLQQLYKVDLERYTDAIHDPDPDLETLRQRDPGVRADQDFNRSDGVD